jgi:hypothetical protein
LDHRVDVALPVAQEKIAKAAEAALAERRSPRIDDADTDVAGTRRH